MKSPQVTSTTTRRTETSFSQKNIPLSQLRVGGQNVRANNPIDDEWIEFVASIHKEGLLQPLIVREVGEQNYEVIGGSRRLRALQQIHANRDPKTDPLVPCYVHSAAKQAIDQLTISAQENVQRRDLSREEWKNVVDKLKGMGQSQQQIAELLHKSTAWVSFIAQQKPWHEPKKTGRHPRKRGSPEEFDCPGCGEKLKRIGKHHYELVPTIDEAKAPHPTAENQREAIAFWEVESSNGTRSQEDDRQRLAPELSELLEDRNSYPAETLRRHNLIKEALAA